MAFLATLNTRSCVFAHDPCRNTSKNNSIYRENTQFCMLFYFCYFLRLQTHLKIQAKILEWLEEVATFLLIKQFGARY